MNLTVTGSEQASTMADTSRSHHRRSMTSFTVNGGSGKVTVVMPRSYR